MEWAVVLKVVRVAMEVISMRLLTILSMAMSFGLALWTMQEPSWERMAMAAFFAVCVFLPCINIERIKNETKDQQN
jgi:membrane protein YdbS with pleckstrin-like domain